MNLKLIGSTICSTIWLLEFLAMESEAFRKYPGVVFNEYNIEWVYYGGTNLAWLVQGFLREIHIRPPVFHLWF